MNSGDPTSPVQGDVRFHALINAIKDYAIFMLDNDGRVVTWNEGAQRIKGYAPDEIIGKSFETFYTPEERAVGLPRRMLERARQDGRAEIEGWRVRKDGSRFWANVVITPLADGTGFVKVTRDLTERRLAEEALRQNEERFRLLIDGIRDYAILLLDRDGTIVSANIGTEQVHGYRVEELIGKNVSLFYTPEDVGNGRPRQLLDRALQQGRVEEEAWRVRKDGNSFYADVVMTPIADKDGRIVGFAKVTRDMTERMRVEDELRQARQRAEEANAIKGEFLANMSHEIRTPMNAILGLTDVLLDSELTPDQRRSLEVVRNSADGLLSVLNEILDLSKIEAGQVVLEEIRFSVSECLGNALRIMAVRADQKGLELICHIAAAVPEYLLGDPTRIQQIVVNLTSNAIKFTEQGEVQISVSVASRESSSMVLQWTVSDTGIGISEEHQKRIFEAFQQADISTTRRFGGTGLGLTISSRLVDAMQGRIWVESEPGKGSRFHFTTPLHVGEPASEPLPTGLRDLKVLLAEDSLTNRLVLEEMLRSFGMQVSSVDSGAAARSALRWARTHDSGYTVALLDARMPNGDGFEVLDEIERDPDLVGMALLMASSGRHRQVPEETAASSVIAKPVMRLDLLRKLRAYLVANAEPTSSSSPGAATKTATPLRILLVEDNPVNQMVASTILQGRGHTLTIAGNGREAIERFKPGEFDIVLMDIQMPEMDGFATLAELQKVGLDVPAIAMTAHAMRGYRERVLSHGFAGYIPKPFKKQELFDMVESMAKRGRPHSDPVLDLDELMERLDHNTDLGRQLVGMFLDTAPKQLEAIRQAVQERRVSDAQRPAHSMKGAAADLSARRLVRVLQEMENVARAGDQAGAEALLARLEAEFDNCRQALVAAFP
ncbi:MAG: PAS domain S-box protein [Candidatus Xenobia bacterium]